MSGQLSFFSAESLPPTVRDLEGLLAGPGQVVRRADKARVSVVVAAPWRVTTLVTMMAVLGLDAQAVPAEEGGTSVRTPFVGALLPLANRWTDGAVKSPPRDFVLDGARLRWWAVAAGSAAGAGESAAYRLALGPSDVDAWAAVGAALHAAGVPGTFVGPRAEGPAYRIVGRRRLVRLRELVGEPPEAAPPGAWPPG